MAKKRVYLVLPEDLIERLYEHLGRDERGKFPRDALSNYIALLISEDLDRPGEAKKLFNTILQEDDHL